MLTDPLLFALRLLTFRGVCKKAQGNQTPLQSRSRVGNFPLHKRLGLDGSAQVSRLVVPQLFPAPERVETIFDNLLILLVIVTAKIIL